MQDLSASYQDVVKSCINIFEGIVGKKKKCSKVFTVMVVVFSVLASKKNPTIYF